MKSGFCAIVGRPSAGKSTLINALTGQKVSIVSPTPQTTRNKVRGIINRDKGQIVFLDTPGMHLSEKKFNNLMMENVSSALSEADVILYVLDVTRAPGKEEEAIRDRLVRYSQPLVVALNKIDVQPNHLLEFQEFLKPLNCRHALGISALNKTGLPELIDKLLDLSPEGERYYPEDYYTDQEIQFRIAEIIREQALEFARQELPHSLYVEIADLEETESGKKLWIRAFLNVERDSQKGILVGKEGSIIKQIRVKSQAGLQKLFDQRIHLDLRIKVDSKWKTDDRLLRKLISDSQD